METNCAFKWVSRCGLKHWLRQLVAIIGWMIIVPTIILVSLAIAVQCNLIVVSSIFTAASFIPPLFLLLVGATGVLFLFLGGYRQLSFGLIAVLSSQALILGDYSCKGIARAWTSPKPPMEDIRNNSTTIKVVALNVQYYEQGISKVMNAIRDTHADIALLSESMAWDHQLTTLEEASKPYTLHLSRLRDSAILTKFPVISYREITLPTRQPSLTAFNYIQHQYLRSPRSFLHAVINANGTPINVLAVRFIAGRGRSHMLWDQVVWGQYLMEQQALEVAAFTDYVKKLDGPILFGGDLNATPTSTTISSLRKLATDSTLATTGWGDMTFKSKLLPTTKEKVLPALRLDYLFSNNLLVPLRTKVLNQVDVSDHFPLYGEFAPIRTVTVSHNSL